MARENRDRDGIRRRDEAASPDEVAARLAAEDEASMEASQRPGPRGRIGGIERDEPTAKKASPRAPEGDEGKAG
jgi:hypothetical protein